VLLTAVALTAFAVFFSADRCHSEGGAASNAAATRRTGRADRRIFTMAAVAVGHEIPACGESGRDVLLGSAAGCGFVDDVRQAQARFG